jgi:hypothetical protein
VAIFIFKNYYLFVYLFLGPIFAPGWPRLETGIFSLKFLFSPKKIHQKLRDFFFFGENVVTLQLSY